MSAPIGHVWSACRRRILTHLCRSCLSQPCCQPVVRTMAPSRRFSTQSHRFNVGKRAGIVATGLAVGLGAAVAASRLYSHDLSLPEVSAASVSNIPTLPPLHRKTHNFVADVVERVAPAVVYIEIQSRHPYSGRTMSMSNGSGFIIREDGIVLTNAHVVANKSQVIVKMQDGRSFEGHVQAVDPVSDLATIKINATGLPTLKLGTSSDIRPGEFVVALGSPFQLSNTVTAGIVSSVHRGGRELGLANKDIGYIQTDAVINFGNSGGPLVNLDGEAIGINTMKVTTGISFAIPSDYAMKFISRAEKIEKRGSRSWFGSSGGDASRVKRRYMGITMLTLTPSIIQELRTRLDQEFPNVEHGVMIHKVVVGSPAYNGGIRPGDVLTHINGKDVSTANDVYKILEETPEMQVVVRRKNDTVHLTIIPEEVR